MLGPKDMGLRDEGRERIGDVTGDWLIRMLYLTGHAATGKQA